MCVCMFVRLCRYALANYLTVRLAGAGGCIPAKPLHLFAFIQVAVVNNKCKLLCIQIGNKWQQEWQSCTTRQINSSIGSYLPQTNCANNCNYQLKYKWADTYIHTYMCMNIQQIEEQCCTVHCACVCAAVLACMLVCVWQILLSQSNTNSNFFFSDGLRLCYFYWWLLA